MMASSVCEPGNQIALMIKLPVASCGCSTRWSDTDPVLLKVSTWQSWGKKTNMKEQQRQVKYQISIAVFIYRIC